MKKTSLFIAVLACIGTAFSQKVSPMRAYNLFYEKDYENAKKCIDQCVLDEKHSQKANTWLYKANIDYHLASQEYSEKQQNEAYEIKYPTAPSESFNAFKKAQSINKNVAGTDMFAPSEALPILYPLLFIEGVNELIANKFESARDILANAVESYEMQTPPQYPLNGELYYYYAYSLEMMKDATNAEKYYKKALEDGSTNVNVFIRLIEGYKNDNRPADVLDVIMQAKKNAPDDANILVAEADYYYWVGDLQRGRDLLNKLPKSIYSSPDALINVANLYIKDSSYVEAETLLKKAYANNPSGVIAHNLGVCCANIGEAKYLEANKLDVENKRNEGAAAKQEADRYMADAAFYFEKSLKEDSQNLTVMRKLRELYLRLSQPEKAAEIERRINELEK